MTCTNTECNRISCRKCKKLAHGSKDCEEAHKESLECPHCLKVYPPEQIVRCEDGHPICIEAAKEYLQGQLGKGVPVLNCQYYPGCGKIYPGTEVLRFIDLNVFKGVPREKLEVMIERVGLKGLVELCPNCTTVIKCGPLSETTVMTCTNTECNRISCRKCKKLAHGSKDCEEAHKESLECPHCLKVYPSEQIVRCEAGHPICIEAAKAYLQTQLGKGVPVLNCQYYPGCDKIYPGTEVLRFIDLNVFKGLPREKLEIMIEKVGVKGLVEICPNCTTVVAPEAGSKIYTCTNCGKVISRETGQEAPPTVPGSDTEKPSTGGDALSPDKLIQLIENGITEALSQSKIEGILTQAIFRLCNTSGCGTQLLKQQGNNLLSCARCKKSQCYLCSQTVYDESHYDVQEDCKGKLIDAPVVQA